MTGQAANEVADVSTFTQKFAGAHYLGGMLEQGMQISSYQGNKKGNSNHWQCSGHDHYTQVPTQPTPPPNVFTGINQNMAQRPNQPQNLHLEAGQDITPANYLPNTRTGGQSENTHFLEWITQRMAELQEQTPSMMSILMDRMDNMEWRHRGGYMPH